jgi:tetratricopeptide (TPR) repeat protein
MNLVNIIEISRATYLAIRDLRNFEAFVFTYYADLSESLLQESAKYAKELVTLEYMVAHSLFRNRKFKEAEKHLAKMESYIHLNAAVYKAWVGKFYALKSVLLSFTGRNKEAIEEMETLLKNKANAMDNKDRLNVELSLAFFYFNEGQFGKANKILLYMTHSDNWYAKKMGTEWVMRKEMIRAIIQYELGNEDIAIRIILSLQNKYKFLFKKPMYKKAEWYLEVLVKYMQNPYGISYKEFIENNFIDSFVIPTKEEESKSLAFYSWIKAKLTNRNYYQVMLEEVSE